MMASSHQAASDRFLIINSYYCLSYSKNVKKKSDKNPENSDDKMPQLRERQQGRPFSRRKHLFSRMQKMQAAHRDAPDAVLPRLRFLEEKMPCLSDEGSEGEGIGNRELISPLVV